MNPIPYDQLSELVLLELCMWREARGEGSLGKRGVAHVVSNRVKSGRTWHQVILKPYQFSSFNANDPNSEKWPADDDQAWIDCCQIAQRVYLGADYDITAGATFYFSPPLTKPPIAEWGPVAITLAVGNLTFCKVLPEVPNTHDDVQEASTAT
jgi:spore germination cell wall hydrolase CwlJ-like protein